MGAVTTGNGLKEARLGVDVERVMELSQSLNNLQDVINRCDNLAHGLEGKLQPILRCAEPQDEATVKEPNYATAMANRVDILCGFLSRTANGLESTLERIEL